MALARSLKFLLLLLDLCPLEPRHSFLWGQGGIYNFEQGVGWSRLIFLYRDSEIYFPFRVYLRNSRLATLVSCNGTGRLSDGGWGWVLGVGSLRLGFSQGAHIDVTMRCDGI